ncbi:MAG: hypothetical protein HRU40_19835 [Saprospiraceae bacterium]|nr:hypothetical protein [Saprospiraceae bacterium]
MTFIFLFYSSINTLAFAAGVNLTLTNAEQSSTASWDPGATASKVIDGITSGSGTLVFYTGTNNETEQHIFA